METKKSIEQRKEALKKVDINIFLETFNEKFKKDPINLLKYSDRLIQAYWNILGVRPRDTGSSIKWFCEMQGVPFLQDTGALINPHDILEKIKDVVNEDLRKDFSDEEITHMIKASQHMKKNPNYVNKINKTPPGLGELLTEIIGYCTKAHLKIFDLILDDADKRMLNNYWLKSDILSTTDKVITEIANYLVEPIKFLRDFEKSLTFCYEHETDFREGPVPKNKEAALNKEAEFYHAEQLENLEEQRNDLVTTLKKAPGNMQKYYKEKKATTLDKSFNLYAEKAKELDKVDEEINGLTSRIRRELYVVKFLENTLLFEPANELVFGEGVYLNKETIEKLINAYQAVDYMINESWKKPENIEKHVQKALTNLGLVSAPDEEADPKLAGDLEKLNELKNVLDSIELKSDQGIEIYDKISSELNNFMGGSGINNQLIIETVSEVKELIKQGPVKGDYTVLNELLIKADPSRIIKTIDDRVISGVLNHLVEKEKGNGGLDVNQYMASNDFKKELIRIIPGLSEVDDEIVSEAISFVAGRVNEGLKEGVPLSYINSLYKKCFS